jgi:general stress protein 26
MTSDEEARSKVAELVQAAKIAYVTTVTPEGQLVSRPLAVQQRDEFDGDLWFFTADPSNKTAQVEANAQVNVAFSADNGYVSISGTATVSHDRAMIDELWDSGAEAWFEGGKDDPSVALLQVHADSAEYWTMDQPMAVTMLKYAKARVTGERPDVGTNESVDL